MNKVLDQKPSARGLRQTFAYRFANKQIENTGSPQSKVAMRETSSNLNSFRIKRLASKDEGVVMSQKVAPLIKQRISGLPMTTVLNKISLVGDTSLASALPTTIEELQSKKPKQKRQLQLRSSKASLPTTQLQLNYQMKNKIGQGAFAQVRLAFSKKLNQPVVIKIYDKIRLIDKQKKNNVKNEISILKETSHNNLIQLMEVVETPTAINIVMQHVKNCVTLRDFVNNGNTPLSQTQLRFIIKELATGLCYLHEKSICHRDIKLQNVLVNNDLTECKLIDFGFAVKAEPTPNLNDSCTINDGHPIMLQYAGTPTYMCPELVNKKNYDPFKADIWALGVLFYYLYSGFFPFRGNDCKAVYKKITKGQLSFPYDVHPGCEYLMRKMLNPDPQERIQADDILKNTWIKPVNFMDEINKLKANHSNNY